MNLNLIKSYIERFILDLDSWLEESQFLWRHYQRFGNHWTLDTPDLKPMILDCCDQNVALWYADHHYPIESLVTYIGHNQEMIRSTFSDLYDQRKELSGRVDRFLFHIDWIQKDYNKSTLRHTMHYHDIGLCLRYLSMRYPQVYAFYHRESFDKFLLGVQAKQVSNVSRIDRFVKVSNIIKKLLTEEILKRDTMPVALAPIIQDYPMILVYLYYREASERYC